MLDKCQKDIVTQAFRDMTGPAAEPLPIPPSPLDFAFTWQDYFCAGLILVILFAPGVLLVAFLLAIRYSL